MTLIEKIQRLKGDEPRLVEHLVDRLLMGQEPYGIWTAAKERREMMGELRDELLDGVAYLCMEAVVRADERKDRRPAERHDEAWQRVAEAWRRAQEALTMFSFDVVEGEVHEVAR